ncbi:MAG: class I SAM-dependent methyltransferase [Deinococcota bacterium]
MMPLPANLKMLEADSLSLGFTMASNTLTGSLLRSLVASKPAGRFLELGTGTGFAKVWMLDGMDDASQLMSVENDIRAGHVAKKHLAYDPRLRLELTDGLTLLQELQGQHFDLIFADTWPGKLERPDFALNLLAQGGFYVIDDMNNRLKDKLDPVAGIPNDVLQRVPKQLRDLETMLYTRADLHCTTLDISTGIMICTKI